MPIPFTTRRDSIDWKRPRSKFWCFVSRHFVSILLAGVLLVWALSLLGCTDQPTTIDTTGPDRLKQTSADVATYTDQVYTQAQEIANHAAAAVTALLAQPPATQPALEHAQAITPLATGLATGATKAKTDFNVAFTKSESDMATAVKTAQTQKTRADDATAKLASDEHKRIMAWVIGLIVAGGVLGALGGYLIFTGSVTIGGSVIAAGATLWGLASLLHFYDEHETAIQVVSLCVLGGAAIWLVLSRIGLAKIQAAFGVVVTAVEAHDPFGTTIKPAIAVQAAAQGLTATVKTEVSKIKSVVASKPTPLTTDHIPAIVSAVQSSAPAPEPITTTAASIQATAASVPLPGATL